MRAHLRAVCQRGHELPADLIARADPPGTAHRYTLTLHPSTGRHGAPAAGRLHLTIDSGRGGHGPTVVRTTTPADLYWTAAQAVTSHAHQIRATCAPDPGDLRPWPPRSRVLAPGPGRAKPQATLLLA